MFSILEEPDIVRINLNYYWLKNNSIRNKYMDKKKQFNQLRSRNLSKLKMKKNNNKTNK